MISASLLEKKPGLMDAPPLTFLEVPAGNLWEELQAQVFTITGGIFQNDAFLLRNNRIIQLGAAAGGQGLTSLAVTDLDQDGQEELLFSYSTGLGPGFGSGLQTRVGMYAPSYDELHTIEADMAYLGIAGLKMEYPETVMLTVIESQESTRVLNYLDTLGELSIEANETGRVLVFRVDPNLSEDLLQKILVKG
jgi:hypothetical protein